MKTSSIKVTSSYNPVKPLRSCFVFHSLNGTQKKKKKQKTVVPPFAKGMACVPTLAENAKKKEFKEFYPSAWQQL